MLNTDDAVAEFRTGCGSYTCIDHESLKKLIVYARHQIEQMVEVQVYGESGRG